MSWIEALKEFKVQNGGEYKIPKKGTPEYEIVKEIQAKNKASKVVSVAPSTPSPVVTPQLEEVTDLPQKVKRKYTRKNAPPLKEEISKDII